MRSLSAQEKCRLKGIGASEIAAILGISPYSDRWEVWARKAGLLPPVIVTERMRWGTALERSIAREFARRMDFKVKWSNKSITHPERAWQRATPDAFVWTPNGEELLEIKNIALDQAGEWSSEDSGEDGVPDYYAAQVHWQMSVTGLSGAWVAALIAGNDLRVYHLDYDFAIARKLIQAGEKFWFEHVVPNVPPPMGPSRAAREYLARRYPTHNADTRTASEEEIAWLEEYHLIKQEIEPRELRQAELENEIKRAIGTHEGLRWEHGKFTWRRTKDSSKTDWEGLARYQLCERTGEERAALVGQFTSPVEGQRRIHFSYKEAV